MHAKKKEIARRRDHDRPDERRQFSLGPADDLLLHSCSCEISRPKKGWLLVTGQPQIFFFRVNEMGENPSPDSIHCGP